MQDRTDDMRVLENRNAILGCWDTVGLILRRIPLQGTKHARLGDPVIFG